MIKSSTKILISAHAKERIIERFDSELPAYGSKREFDSVVSKIIRQGKHLEDWKRVPFYYNSIAIKRGPGSEFIQNGRMMFVCALNEQDDTLTVVTAVPRMLYYPLPGSISMGTAGGAKYVDEARYLAGLEVEAHIEYRSKFGGTPKELWHNMQNQPKIKVKADPEIAAQKALEEEQAQRIKLEEITLKLLDKSKLTAQDAEDLYNKQFKLLRKFKELTNEHERQKYLTLIDLLEADIMKANKAGTDDSKFHKKMRRYHSEIMLKGLTS